MSTSLLSHEMSLSTAAATTAEYVFDLEAPSVDKESRDLISWASLPVYDDPLSLNVYSGEGEPSFRFRIGGDLPDELIIFTRNTVDTQLVDDPYVQYFFERYLGIIARHEHDICINIVTELVKQKQMRNELFKAQQERNNVVGHAFETGTDAMMAQPMQGTLLSWLK